MEKEIVIEERLIKAARKVFVEKGYDGARVRDIAKEADINVSLLNYYFRSKEKLFDLVFEESFGMLIKNVGDVMSTPLPFFDKIRQLVARYLDFFIENPMVPNFVINELTRNPQRLEEIIERKHLKKSIISVFSYELQHEIDKGTVRPVSSEHLLINMLSMCIFPVLAKPMIKIVFDKTDTAFNTLLTERANEIADFVIQSIKVK